MTRDRPPLFPHEQPELFEAAIRLAVDRRSGVLREHVEKDYWVTFTLAALQRAGFELHFKGGTSLAKGFQLIERFSEDLDVKIDAPFLPDVDDKVWKRTDDKAQAARRAFFDELLATELPAPLTWRELPEFTEERVRNLGIRVDYPQVHAPVDDLMRPYVLLEVGRARVTPSVDCTVSSWVHEELVRAGQPTETEPTVRCVHPLVTLFEKASALQGRVQRDIDKGGVDPARYVRHFEDAVHILRAWDSGRLPPVDGYDSPKALAAELVRTKDTPPLDPSHSAFNPDHDTARATRQRDALRRLDPFYWGKRIPLDQACEELRGWLKQHL